MTTVSIIAIIIGVIGIVMAFVASRQNKALQQRLERVDERVTSLTADAKLQQDKTEKEKANLQAELEALSGQEINLDGPPPVEMETDSGGPAPISEITPEELKARMDQEEDLFIIDMRQQFEHKTGHIPGAVNIFVNDIPLRVEEIPHDQDIVLQCWSGNTSLQAAMYLIEQGWPAQQVHSLIGGIGGWTQTYGMDGLEKEV